MTSRRESLEREWKLATDLDFEMPELTGLTSRLPEQHLHTTYFDTPDLRLWEADITLRHRQGEQHHEGVWTLKLPSASKGGSTLDRTELEWPGDIGSVPGEAVDILRGVVRRLEARPIAELSTERRRMIVHDATGMSRAELDDDMVTVVNGRGDGHRFREIELELGQGADEWGHGVIERLRRAGARLSNEPKLTKAIGLPARNSRRSTERLSKSSGLGDVITASISAGFWRLLDHDYRIRLSPADPDAPAIHQARVATRRLRSDLKTFRAVLDPVWVGHTRKQLKHVGEALGRVRDIDVLIGNVGMDEALPEASNGLLELRAELEHRRSQASGELAEVMKGEEYIELLDRLHAATRRTPYGERSVGSQRAAREIPSLVRRRWRALERKVKEAGRHPDAVSLHRIRIRAKQLRYAAEAVTPVIGKPAKRTARAAENIQTVLGDHHDSIEAQQWLGLRGLGRSPDAEFTAGWLSARRQRDQTTVESEWPSMWSKLDRKKVTGWMK